MEAVNSVYSKEGKMGYKCKSRLWGIMHPTISTPQHNTVTFSYKICLSCCRLSSIPVTQQWFNLRPLHESVFICNADKSSGTQGQFTSSSRNLYITKVSVTADATANPGQSLSICTNQRNILAEVHYPHVGKSNHQCTMLSTQQLILTLLKNPDKQNAHRHAGTCHCIIVLFKENYNLLCYNFHALSSLLAQNGLILMLRWLCEWVASLSDILSANNLSQGYWATNNRGKKTSLTRSTHNWKLVTKWHKSIQYM